MLFSGFTEITQNPINFYIAEPKSGNGFKMWQHTKLGIPSLERLCRGMFDRLCNRKVGVVSTAEVYLRGYSRVGKGKKEKNEKLLIREESMIWWGRIMPSPKFK